MGRVGVINRFKSPSENPHADQQTARNAKPQVEDQAIADQRQAHSQYQRPERWRRQMHALGRAVLGCFFNRGDLHDLPVVIETVFAVPPFVETLNRGDLIKVVLRSRRRNHPLKGPGIPRIGTRRRQIGCLTFRLPNIVEQDQN